MAGRDGVVGIGGTGCGGAVLKRAGQASDPAIDSPTMLKSFDTLAKIKTYIDKDAAGRDWNLATAMVMNGGRHAVHGRLGEGANSPPTKSRARITPALPHPALLTPTPFNIDRLRCSTKAANAKRASLISLPPSCRPSFRRFSI